MLAILIACLPTAGAAFYRMATSERRRFVSGYLEI
jgi:hypothetical protein